MYISLRSTRRDFISPAGWCAGEDAGEGTGRGAGWGAGCGDRCGGGGALAAGG